MDAGDPFVGQQFDPFQHPLVWCLQDFLQQGFKAAAVQVPSRTHCRHAAEDMLMISHGADARCAGGSSSSIESSFVRSQEQQIALKVGPWLGGREAAEELCKRARTLACTAVNRMTCCAGGGAAPQAAARAE